MVRNTSQSFNRSSWKDAGSFPSDNDISSLKKRKNEEQHLWLCLVVLLSGIFPVGEAVAQTPPQFLSSHSGASSGLAFCVGGFCEVGDAHRELGNSDTHNIWWLAGLHLLFYY